MEVSKDHISKLSLTYGLSEHFFEVVTSRGSLETIIKDIQSDQDVSLDVLQFIYNTDYYRKIEHNLLEKRKLLSTTETKKNRISINQEINRIELELKQYKINVLVIAKSLLELESDSMYSDVFRHFFRGELSVADRYLDDKKLMSCMNELAKGYDEAKALKETYTKLVENAYGFLLKAEFTSIDFEIASDDRFHKCAELYEKGMESMLRSKQLKDIAKFRFFYAYFLLLNNQTQESKALFLKTVQNYKDLSKSNAMKYLPDLSWVLNNLAMMEGDSNEVEESQKHYLDSLEIKRFLESKNREKYLPDTALTLNNLGNLYRKSGQFDLALQCYEEAAEIRREFSKKNPSEVLPYLATTFNNLGLLYRAMNDLQESEAFHQKALKIREDLIKSDRKKYRPDLAMSLSNLGVLKWSKKEFSDAKEYTKKALKVYEELALENGKRYTRYVAIALHNLGALHWEKNELKQSSEHLIHALKLRRILHSENPALHLSDLASTLHNLGVLYLDLDDKQRARSYLEEAYLYREQLSTQNPWFEKESRATFSYLKKTDQ